MKRLSLLFGFILCLVVVQAQRFVLYSADSSRIKYATFQEMETRGMSSDEFFSSFLRLDPQNRFVPSDTMYSPDSAYTYIKYRQQYAGYEAEGAIVTLTYHNHSIIRFNGYYIPAKNLLLRNSFSDKDAITVFKQYYNCQNDSCDYFVSKLVTHNPQSKQIQLCFQIQCTDPTLYNKILYVSTDDLSIFRENDLPSAGFNATFCTMYNGVRQGFDWALDGTPCHWLKDTAAAVQVLSLGYNKYITDIKGPDDVICNSSSYWCNTSYPQYMLDAYWSATQFSYYFQQKFHYPKHYFQRFWYNDTYSYEVRDTLTQIYIATNTYVDRTLWAKIIYRPYYPGRDLPQNYYRNIIVIGTPGTAHNPKASIDETVHEYAHIFSSQNWYTVQIFPSSADDALAEACADIWAAVITSQIYPNNEDKIWKIGEDVVLPTSGNTCIRNLADPSDEDAEIQIFADNCQSTAGDAYERSGVISHWFYLLTHGCSGTGCDGMCYNFPAIPIDSAAKLLYHCETNGFNNDMEYSDICQATVNATAECFSDPENMLTSVLGAWNALGVKPLDYGIEQFGLSYATTNSGVYTIDADLVIEAPNTLTVSGILRIGENCKIVVQPGAKFVVDGGILTSACFRSLWPGIEVIGDRTKRQLPQWQGIVELKNGAVIENAHCAIHTGYQGDGAYATTGGIIKADSAFFINNRRAVAFLSYENTLLNGSVASNQSYFKRCFFSVNDDNFFALNNCQFIDHVTMWEVRGVKFNGCLFTNTITTSGDRRHAIYAEDAGFEVNTYCRVQNYIGCECPENHSVHCEFSGFTTAVEASTDGDPYAVLVNRAKFFNNVTGLKINDNTFATITRNDFNLQNRPSKSNNIGLYLNTCSGYQVEENRFHRAGLPVNFTSTGIKVHNNGITDNSIYRNIFDTLSYGIYVSGTNGSTSSGLQMLCGDFNKNNKDIYLATSNTTVSPLQGSLQISAGNTFNKTNNYNIQSLANQNMVYFYTGQSNAGNPYYPALRTTNVLPYLSKSENPCTSTLCDGGGTPKSLAQFQSDMSAYTAAVVGTDDDADAFDTGAHAGTPLQTMRQSLSETYYTAVRALMSDTVLDLDELEQWHAAAQPIGDPYSLTETRFMLGCSEPFTADAEDAELSNYADFHALKLALRDNAGAHAGAPQLNSQNSQNSPFINWYALTDGQIAQLQTIAERNTGRASVMAKGVLCFFHGICYEDEWDDAGVFDTPQQDGDTTGTRAKHIATDNPDDATLSVYPNPVEDVLFVELRGGAGIANVALYDLQGRIVTGVLNTPQQVGTATINVRNIPEGVYVLCVTDGDGKEYRQKIVRK